MICPRCERPDLTEIDFAVCRARPSGRTLYCKQCLRQRVYAGRANNIARGLRGDGKPRRRRRPKTVIVKPEPIKDGSIDAGLLVLSKIVPYGIALSQEDIAIACGCARSRIGQIENKALDKLRARLQADGELRSKLAAFV
jgi:hypothetical protein